jgi:hypothetical protein
LVITCPASQGADGERSAVILPPALAERKQEVARRLTAGACADSGSQFNRLAQ